MWSGSALVLLCVILTVNPEINSLIYIYTAFTRPVGLPGIHEFTAVGLLDGRPIDYFDSDTQVKVPKEDWMRERLSKDYWDKGTSSRQTKQQWFKVNLKIVNYRQKKNDTVNHYLQWRHGCVLDTDGPERKISGIDQYGYDGDDFLSFDSVSKQWVAHMDGANLTKDKWDRIQEQNDYTDGYLHNECVQWLDTFLKYRKEADIKASPPKVYISARPVKNNLKLSCLATGFHAKEITMNIRTDGLLVDRDDGLKSTGIRPNGDGTHQIKMWVMIHGGDTAKYTCEVHHPASNIHVVEEWDHHVEAEGPVGLTMGLIVGAVVALLVVVGLIITGVVIILRRRTAAERVVTILPLHIERKALLTGETVRELPGNNGEKKKPLKGPGSEASYGCSSGIGTGIGNGSSSGSCDDISHGSSGGSHSGSIDGSHSGSIDGSHSGSIDGSHSGVSSGVSDGSRSSLEKLPV